LDRAFRAGELVAIRIVHPEIILPAKPAAPSTSASLPPRESPSASSSDAKKGPLSKKEAQRLFDELAGQPHIPFNYPVDCCYTRAHEMCRIMEGKGVECQKYWLYEENWGKALMKAELHPVDKVGNPVTFPDPDTGEREPVKWVYHVAPMIKVQQEDGSVVDMVMDPSLAKTPLTKAQWEALMGSPSGAYSRVTDSKSYFYNPLEGTSLEDPDGTETQRQLEEHRASRDEALQAERARTSGLK
jgi:hypothetical protein